MTKIITMNIVMGLLSVASVAAIRQAIPWKEMSLYAPFYLSIQTELAGIRFGISAFIRSGSLGSGLVLATVMFLMITIANISDSKKILEYDTVRLRRRRGYCGKRTA